MKSSGAILHWKLQYPCTEANAKNNASYTHLRSGKVGRARIDVHVGWHRRLVHATDGARLGAAKCPLLHELTDILAANVPVSGADEGSSLTCGQNEDGNKAYIQSSRFRRVDMGQYALMLQYLVNVLNARPVARVDHAILRIAPRLHKQHVKVAILTHILAVAQVGIGVEVKLLLGHAERKVAVDRQLLRRERDLLHHIACQWQG